MTEREGLGVQEEEQEEEKEQEEESQVDAAEEEARSHGWVSLKEWEADGKDPGDWANFKAFNKNGSLFGRINDLEADQDTFGMRLKNINRMHEVQKNDIIKEYERQKTAAIKDGDVEEVKKLDEQINSVNAQEAATDDQSLLAQWNEDNDWIFDTDDPKTKFAKNAFVLAQGNSLSVKDAIAEVDKKVAKRFPGSEKNPRRNEPTNQGGGKPKGGKGKALTLNDLTAEEKGIFSHSSFDAFSDKEKLVMLKDARAE